MALLRRGTQHAGYGGVADASKAITRTFSDYDAALIRVL